MKLLFKRLRQDWPVLLGIFVGMLLATSLVASAPVFLRALDRLAFATALDSLESPYLNINVFGSNVSLRRESMDEADRALSSAVEQHLDGAVSSTEQYFKTPLYLAGTPSQPLPGPDTPPLVVSRGYLQYLSGLAQHSTFVSGRMAGNEVKPGPAGAQIEAVVSVQTAQEFGLRPGDLVSLAPSVVHPTRVFARIVGVIEPDDASTEYWRLPKLFLDPAPPLEAPEQGLVIDPGEAPLALFVDRNAMIEAVVGSFPGSLVDPIWFLLADHETLKTWSIENARQRLDAFREQVGRDIPGASASTGGFNSLIDDLRLRSFFSKLPVLLLMATIVATVVLYLSISFSFVVRRRQSDLALLKARGADGPRLLRFYSPEIVALTTGATVLGPFVALGAVALAGRLPSLRGITGGANLPVEPILTSFVAAAGTGLLLLAILLVYTRAGARGGPVPGRLWSSRPPSTSVFHRYYLDFALVVLGGLVFWELQARGHVVSGGLFKGIEVNEALLATPMLLLVVVSIMFVRFFPLVVRFVSGESPMLLHLLAAATVPAAAVVTLAADVPVSDWAPPVILVLVLGATYWATSLAQRGTWVAAGLALQAAATSGYFVLRPPDSEGALAIPVFAVLALVPAQFLFRSLAAARRLTPVSLLLVQWRMARDPLRYTWLIMLVILASGLATSSTTVGATLDQGQEDGIHYELASDIHVAGQDGAAGIDSLLGPLSEVPGLALASPALRETARVGGADIELLAVESGSFARVAWYRDDLADRSMFELMAAVRPAESASRVPIPDGAITIGAWVKPGESASGLSLWMLVEDAAGEMHTIDLGTLGPPEWARLSANLPEGLEAPLYLAAVQVFEPSDNVSNLSEFSDLVSGTPGTIYLDDLYVTVSKSGAERVFEDFEGVSGWSPLVTDPQAPDQIAPSEKEVHRGIRSGRFTFGSERNRLVRGFQRSPTGGPVPVVVSPTFLETSGLAVGQSFVAEVASRLVPFRVSATAKYFPTVSPDGTGFLVADLDSLLGNLDLLTYSSPRVRPNELFLSTTTGAEERVLSAVRELSGATVEAKGYETELGRVRLDPLGGAGWRALVWVSLIVAVFAGGLGYGTYLLSSETEGHREAGVLRAAGLTGRQLGWLLAFEHLAVSLIGLGIGTWTGLQMSSLMTSSVAVTPEGLPVVPPIVMVTDWRLLIPFYIALLAVVAGALFMLRRPGTERRSQRVEG